MVPKVAALLLVVPASASTMMSIVSESNPDYCLDLLGERTQPGTHIDTWQCVAGLLGQQWIFEEGSWQVKSAVDTNKCIDGGDLKPGSQLTLQKCNTTSTSQYYGWDSNTNAIYSSPDKGSVKPTGSLCMKVPEKTELQGGAIELTACNATSKGQQWSAKVGPPPSGKNETFTFTPAAKASTLCLELKDNKVENGATIDLAECKAGSKGQEWIFSQGSYRIATALNPNKCVDATDMSWGSQPILWDCNGFPQQTWGYQDRGIKDHSEGSVYLTQAKSPYNCLTYDLPVDAVGIGLCSSWILKRVHNNVDNIIVV
jgi:hypothetical protein